MAAQNWNDTSTWASNQDKCMGKKCFDDNGGFPDLLELATETTGWTLEKATRACRAVPNKLMAIRAGDDESYDLFAPMFNDLITRWHGIDITKNVAVPEDYSEKVLPALPASGAEAIKSTRIRTARNLAGYPFTNNMSAAQRLEIEELLKQVFAGFQDPLLQGTYYPMVGMSDEQHKELVDAHYLYINDDPTLETSGCYDDWPQGRGIFINDDRSTGVFIVWVGEEDQMRIMAMNKGSDVQAVWNLFYKGVEAVHNGVKALGKDFAFKESHGYLSTCPSNIGTGMRASVHVDLPSFANKHDLHEYVKEQGWLVDIRGTRGEVVSTDGCTVYDVSNQGRVGSDCGQQIQAMVSAVKALLEMQN